LVGRICALRALQPADAGAIARHADDPAVAFNLFQGFPQPYTLALAEAWCGEQHRRAAHGQVWAIDVAGEAIGCASVRPDHGWLACNAEVGYWIGRSWWRRGIASEALALMTTWTWAHLPAVQRLYAPILARNAGSQGVAARAGYVLEGRLPRSRLKGGEVIDSVLWACYRPAADCAA
jgi:RimJ/RimL family protein N-acetyltransferase